ncbi:DUF971 family protein [Duganella sp. CF458]|uniref:DUF971 domain-containing protein n=1 Tax=Duganella sp. CF458 TaxID=1884368 RepID=UPI0008E682FA|nr:DUF971 domain-containing protein [Duganella sp. CF458]SFG21433.1 DUF971 family protein [Duganella sp. CF458]
MTPLSIEHDADAAHMIIYWPDALMQRLDTGLLRRSCRCADCASRARAGQVPSSGAGLRLMRIVPVGSYGVQLVFSDGHERGIYPWPYLRGL